MDKIAVEILERLDAVGEITRGAIEEIIPMASRQIIVDGFLALTVSIVLLIAMAIVSYIIYKDYKHTDFSSYSEREDFHFTLLIGSIFNISCSIIFFTTLHTALSNLLATEWQVIDLIVSKIGG